MATIRKRNDKFQVQVRIRGHSKSATFLTLKHARHWGRQKELEFEKSFQLGELYRPKHFLEVLDLYKQKVMPLKKSPNNEYIIIQSLSRHSWVKKPLHLIQPLDITAYRDTRLLKVKPSTFTREFGVVKHALKIAKIEWGWDVPLELFTSIKIPKINHKALRRIQDKDLKLLLQHTNNHRNKYLQPILLFALETGMRRGEILSLKWLDVDMKRKLITVDNTKNGYPRIIPMNDNVYHLLKTIDKRNEYVFPITTNSLRLAFQRICKKLEIKIRFHDFRHEAISRLFERGHSIPQIASISGHRTMSQLFRYAHTKL